MSQPNPSNWPLSSGQDQNRSVSPLGAISKGSNGVVAVGLPHRNYSVFKQAHINQWEVKGTERAPADLHPPLNKTKIAKAVVEDRNPG